jgi:protein TonB
MKMLTFIALVFLFIAGCKSSTDKQETPVSPGSFNKEDYKIEVGEMPMPIGGILAIQDKVVYPEEAKNKKIEGKVFVLAFVDEKGDVVNAEVIKSANPILDSAAVKAVRQVKFEPGKHEGKKVKVQVTVPIVFKLR